MKRFLLYGLFTILVTFGATEVFLRIFSPLPPGQAIVFDLVQEEVPTIQRKVHYERNRWGFRSLSMQSEEKGERTIRIMAIGGSTTEQSSQRTEDVWSGILDQKLNEALSPEGIRVEVAAWGGGGYRTWNGYEFCKGELPAYEPDLVIHLWGINDLTWVGGPGRVYEGRAARMAKIEKRIEERALHESRWVQRFKDWIRQFPFVPQHSQLMLRLRAIKRQREIKKLIDAGDLVNWEMVNLSRVRREYQEYPYRETVIRNPDPGVEFGDGLEALLGCLQEQGIASVFLGQPTLWKDPMTDEEKGALWFPVKTPEGPVRPSGKWLANEMARYNQIQEKLAGAHGAFYFALDQSIPKNLEYFFDDCHFTDKGNRAVAEVIYPLVLSIVQQVARDRGLIS